MCSTSKALPWWNSRTPIFLTQKIYACANAFIEKICILESRPYCMVLYRFCTGEVVLSQGKLISNSASHKEVFFLFSQRLCFRSYLSSCTSNDESLKFQVSLNSFVLDCNIERQSFFHYNMCWADLFIPFPCKLKKGHLPFICNTRKVHEKRPLWSPPCEQSRAWGPESLEGPRNSSRTTITAWICAEFGLCISRLPIPLTFPGHFLCHSHGPCEKLISGRGIFTPYH